MRHCNCDMPFSNFILRHGDLPIQSPNNAVPDVVVGKFSFQSMNKFVLQIGMSMIKQPKNDISYQFICMVSLIVYWRFLLGMYD